VKYIEWRSTYLDSNWRREKDTANNFFVKTCDQVKDRGRKMVYFTRIIIETVKKWLGKFNPRETIIIRVEHISGQIGFKIVRPGISGLG
jgi:hypothetical protein